VEPRRSYLGVLSILQDPTETGEGGKRERDAPLPQQGSSHIKNQDNLNVEKGKYGLVTVSSRTAIATMCWIQPQGEDA